jgi:hypothetical protein
VIFGLEKFDLSYDMFVKVMYDGLMENVLCVLSGHEGVYIPVEKTRYLKIARSISPILMSPRNVTELKVTLPREAVQSDIKFHP